MTSKSDMSAPKMTRVTVRVPRTTLDQINAWVDALGVRRSHFLGIALVAGVRSLMQASALEMSLSPESGSQPEGDQTPEHPAQPLNVPSNSDSNALNMTIETLSAEVKSLRAEVKDLKMALKDQLRSKQSGREYA
jgi:hypothetical protein